MTTTMLAPSTVAPGSTVDLPDGTGTTVGATGRITVNTNFVPALLAAGYTLVPSPGAAVTQITSRATGVTINAPVGQITTDNSSLADAGVYADFVVTNSYCHAVDTVVVSIIPGGTGAPAASVVNVANGAFTVRITNQSATTADTSADKVNFRIMPGAIA